MAALLAKMENAKGEERAALVEAVDEIKARQPEYMTKAKVDIAIQEFRKEKKLAHKIVKYWQHKECIFDKESRTALDHFISLSKVLAQIGGGANAILATIEHKVLTEKNCPLVVKHLL